MEREISSATWLAVSMASLAAFIGIVIWTVSVGNSAKNEVVEFGSDLAYNMESGELSNLVNTCTEMSKAAAYNLLTRNYNNISQVDIYTYTSGDLSDVVAEFEDKMDKDSPAIAGTSLNKWRTTREGFWSVNGDPNAGNQVLMAYEILLVPSGNIKTNGSKKLTESALGGRIYMTVNTLTSSTFRVKILEYAK